MVHICRSRHTPVFGAALACAGLLAAVRPAAAQQAVSACVNPAGQVRFIGETETCRSREQLVTWSMFGAPTVVDANGARIGFYMGGLALVHSGDDWFSVGIGRQGFNGPSFGFTFAFLTSDCSGQRYVTASADILVPAALVMSNAAVFADLNAGTVTVPGTPDNPGTFWVKQIGGPPGMPPGDCFEVPAFGPVTLSPVKSVDVSGFVPPFSIK
jgi:hypothetical protein